LFIVFHILKFERAAPLGAEIRLSEKVDFGWVRVHLYTFVDSGAKFTRFVMLNAGWFAVDHIVFQLLIS